mmetsp:Transcript_41883/g.64099  ORF Transcript_41883/g.64099 Transcript_41883/m.64099 type:complete len:165 (-) Transcript_41883:980-1474(-)
MKEGTLVIDRLQWELFEIVRCTQDLKALGGSKNIKQNESILKFKVIEETAEIKMDLQFENNDSDMVYTEHRKGVLLLTNCSMSTRLLNGYLNCSYPILFNFETKSLFNEILPGATLSVPVIFRASVAEFVDVKFLLRYEVDKPDALDTAARFRFQRMCFSASIR